ncbi:hypothetical protein GCM10022254_23360 [Actinomadura meridiana]|uniref:Uncharacterized protein n=1 Tax=Actinomadura meridiana TaxID=559626 RepID=A0ABP8BXR7_9ACTN
MISESPISPEEQEAVLRDVGGGVLAAAPDGWTQLRFRLDVTTELASNRFEATMEDGSIVHLSAPDRPRRSLQKLREQMYSPGKGAWFTARYVIVRPGRYSVEFDYENEPDFGFEIDALTYANDLKSFPRDDEHIPDWLRQKINESEASEEG